MRFLVVAIFASLFAACASAPPAPTPAPDFMLLDQADRHVRLSDFKGRKNVVLVFYFGHG